MPAFTLEALSPAALSKVLWIKKAKPAYIVVTIYQAPCGAISDNLLTWTYPTYAFSEKSWNKPLTAFKNMVLKKYIFKIRICLSWF
jgi:hypothetical protein